MLETNGFRAGNKHFSAKDERVENARSNLSHTQLATSDFQTDLRLRWLLLTSTHLWKRAVSRSRTHLWVYATSTWHIYAIAFSARLNGLQVHQVDRENDKQTSTYTWLVLSKLVTACNLACMQRTRSVVRVWPGHTLYLPCPHNYCLRS